MAYCTKEQVRAAGTGITASSSPPATDSLLTDLIESASRFFDLEAGVKPGYFEPAGLTATARTFYGDGSNYIKLDPYVEGSLSSTITMPEGYTVPSYAERNGHLVITTSDGLHPPFRGFYNSTWSGWPTGVGVTVTARWGYAATPADVRQAVIELVINLLRETDPAALKLVNIDGWPVREKCPPRVLEIAKKYRSKGVMFV